MHTSIYIHTNKRIQTFFVEFIPFIVFEIDNVILIADRKTLIMKTPVIFHPRRIFLPLPLITPPRTWLQHQTLPVVQGCFPVFVSAVNDLNRMLICTGQLILTISRHASRLQNPTWLTNQDRECRTTVLYHSGQTIYRTRERGTGTWLRLRPVIRHSTKVQPGAALGSVWRVNLEPHLLQTLAGRHRRRWLTRGSQYQPRVEVGSVLRKI